MRLGVVVAVVMLLAHCHPNTAHAKPQGREGRQASKILESLSSSLLYMFGSNKAASENDCPLRKPKLNSSISEESHQNRNGSQEKPLLEKRILRSGSSEQLSEGKKPNVGKLQTKTQKPKSRRPPLQERVSLGNQKNEKEPVQPSFIRPAAPNPGRTDIFQTVAEQRTTVGGRRPSRVQPGPSSYRPGPSMEPSMQVSALPGSELQTAVDWEGTTRPSRQAGGGVYEAAGAGNPGNHPGNHPGRASKVRQSQVDQAENQEDFGLPCNKETGPFKALPSAISHVQQELNTKSELRDKIEVERTGSDALFTATHQLGIKSTPLDGRTTSPAFKSASSATNGKLVGINPTTKETSSTSGVVAESTFWSTANSEFISSSPMSTLVVTSTSPTMHSSASKSALTSQQSDFQPVTRKSENRKRQMEFSQIPLPSPKMKLDLVLGQTKMKYRPSHSNEADEARNSNLKLGSDNISIGGSQHQAESQSFLELGGFENSSALTPLSASTSIQTVMGAVVGALALLLLLLGIIVFILLLRRPSQTSKNQKAVPARPLPPAPPSNPISPSGNLHVEEDHQSSSDSGIFLPSSDEPDVIVFTSLPSPNSTPAASHCSPPPPPPPLQFVPLDRIYSNNMPFASSASKSTLHVSIQPSARPEKVSEDLQFYAASSSCSSCLSAIKSTIQNPLPSSRSPSCPISSVTPTVSMLQVTSPSGYSTRSQPRSWIGGCHFPASPQPPRPLPPTPCYSMSKSLDNLDEIYALRRNSEEAKEEQETNLDKSYTIVDEDFEENYEEGIYDRDEKEESSYCQVSRVGEGLQQRLGSLREEDQSRERPVLVIEQEKELFEKRQAKNRESPIYNEVNEDSGVTEDEEVIIKKKTEKETAKETQISVDEKALKEKKLSDSYWILPKVEVVQFGEPVWDQSDLDNELD